jgi:hypothetical protein
VSRLVAVALLGLVLLRTASGADAQRAPSPATLLARHVPILILHQAELFRPVPVEGFLADSDLQRPVGGGAWETVGGPLPAGGRELRLDQRLCRAADGPAASQCYATAEAAHGAAPVVYGTAFRRGKRIDLQYWLWYPFNPYSPTVPAGELWQVHEGDWEAVSVVTDLLGRPLAAGYSQHGEGRRRDWPKVPKQGTHPIVYVALGSHANYFTAGTQRFDPRVVEPILISIVRQAGFAPVDHTGNGRRIRPRLVRVSAATPAWMTFAGTWGEDQYIRAPGGQPQTFGGAPRGPAFTEHWQRPVVEALSWPRG